MDIDAVYGEKGYSTNERNSIRPTLDVNGIWGGYTGEGAKTVIASQAFAKISMRLVPNQDPTKITNLFKSHFESIKGQGNEIIVGDYSSTDNTKDIAKEYGFKVVKIRKNKNYKFAESKIRNKIIRETKCNFLVDLNANVEYPKNTRNQITLRIYTSNNFISQVHCR